ncbi:extradiol dioxygenase [Streptomyces sp. NPDC001288]|uniref:extradiol dioxygenase n=1 Tax=unclassified Streptomyces TaxID=2593676 RepID=UPI00332EAC36
MSTTQPVILTADQDVLLGFSTKLSGTEEIFRGPAQGPALYLGLRTGDTDLGLVAKENPGTGAAPRILLGIGVDDVDETLGRPRGRGWPRPVPGCRSGRCGPGRG